MRLADMPQVTLRGSPRERGRSHGEQLRERVRATVAKYKDVLAADHGRDPDVLIEKLIGESRFERHIRKRCPDLADEIRGIAEGAHVPQNDVLALNLLDEMDWFAGGRADHSGKCSAAAMRSADGVLTVAGQNMDIGTWCEGSQVLLRIIGNGAQPDQLVFTIAGSAGLNGINTNGLAVCLNALPMLASSINGLPVTFVLRCLLRLTSVRAAVGFLRSIAHASGQNYLLCDAGEIASVECSGRKAARVAYRKFQDRVIHTNHPLVDDYLADEEPWRPEHAGVPSLSTFARYESLDRRMMDAEARPTVAFFEAMLRAKDDAAHPVCRSRDDAGRSTGYTIGSSIYEIPAGGGPPRLHLCPGPPDAGEFGTFTLGFLGTTYHQIQGRDIRA